MNPIKLKITLSYFFIFLLVSCGGPRINRKAEPLVNHGPMLTVEDTHLNFSLDRLMFRNSHGSWAKDANWDEYLMTLQTSNDIIIESVMIEDIMGEWHEPQTTRKALNKSTKQVKKKYKKAGYKIKLGSGSTHATAVGLSMAVGSGVTAGAVTATGAVGNLTSVGVGAAVAVPALVIAGVTKVVYNTRVNNRIQQRQTLLPLTVSDETTALDILFPAIPLPQKLKVNYQFEGISHQISLDLNLVTSDLHIKSK